MRQMRHLHRCSFIYKLLELLLVLRLTTPEYDRWCDGECERWRLEAGGGHCDQILPHCGQELSAYGEAEPIVISSQVRQGAA